MPVVIPPVPNLDDQFFWDGVAAGRLLVQRCGSCGVLRHPPQPMCAVCGSLERDTQEASGRGTVFAWLISAPGPSGGDERFVALVELEEGIRLVSNLVGVERQSVTIGMPVRVEFVEVDDGVVLPQFRPEAGA